MISHKYSSMQKQQGVVIVVALVTLLVMTMVGLTSIGNATLQERMAANNRFYLQSRLNSETALRFAEDYLSGVPLKDVNGTDIAVPNLDTKDNVFTTFSSESFLHMNVVVSNGQAVGSLNNLSDKNDLSSKVVWGSISATDVLPISTSTVDKADNAQVVIEFIGTGSPSTEVDLSRPEVVSSDFGTKPFLFRVTAIGYSANDNIYSVLESIYSTAL